MLNCLVLLSIISLTSETKLLFSLSCSSPHAPEILAEVADCLYFQTVQGRGSVSTGNSHPHIQPGGRPELLELLVEELVLELVEELELELEELDILWLDKDWLLLE